MRNLEKDFAFFILLTILTNYFLYNTALAASDAGYTP